MDERDQELDAILGKLRDDMPTELELRRWQSVAGKPSSPWQKAKIAFALVAACFLGTLIGGLMPSQRLRTEPVCSCEPQIAEKNAADATIEQTYAKMN